MVDKLALIGRYMVDRELGSGGMGEVYLAYSPAGDPVAVKVIRGDRLDPVTPRPVREGSTHRPHRRRDQSCSALPGCRSLLGPALARDGVHPWS